MTVHAPPGRASIVAFEVALAIDTPAAPTPTATPNADPLVDGVAVAENDTVSDAVMLPAPYAFTVGVTVAEPDAPAPEMMPPATAVAFAVAVCVASAETVTFLLE